MQLSQENQRWLAEFRRYYGRSPRILHIGNIANNAYLNAKLLNARGFDCDVICYDYYHVMGCPEWEDGELLGDYGDPFRPDWVAADVRNFERPKWFAQGPLQLCFNYLLAKRGLKSADANNLWDRLSSANGTKRDKTSNQILIRNSHRWIKVRQILGRFAFGSQISTKVARYIDDKIGNRLKSEFFRLLLTATMSVTAAIIYLIASPLRFKKQFLLGAHFDLRVKALIDRFSIAFSERPDALTASDLESFRNTACEWKKLFCNYDLVQAYATDPIIPLLAGHRYVAFEHGTIRNIPFEPTQQGRLCALSYRQADWVIITNADNLKAARKLGIADFTFVPHPVNESVYSAFAVAKKLRDELLVSSSANFLVFHPARQHWSPEQRHPDWEKGNDIFLNGFARFVKEANPRAIAVLVEWGATLKETRKLISHLSIDANVRWVPPMSNIKMVQYILASDLVADQFFLGAFGSIVPKSLACSRPTLLYFNSEIHTECFPVNPPVLSARTPDGVFSHLAELSADRQKIDNLGFAGRNWYERYHSNQVIVDKLVEIYSRVLL